MTRIALLSLLVAGCTRDHALQFRLALSPQTCQACTGGPSSISLTDGVTVGLFVEDDTPLPGADECVEIEPGAVSEGTELPGFLGGLDVDVDAGSTATFRVQVARPQAATACQPSQQTPPIILYGTSAAVTLTGDPAPIRIPLSCINACP